MPLNSGCITSAESVLITMQSHAEVLNFLENNPPPPSCHYRFPVISIAPQSLASLAASLSSSSSQPVSLLQVLRRVSVFCRDVLGFEHVYDTTFARHISLLEHAKEFAERKSGEGKLPMLASACPGWVCYAEKTHAEMLPFISRTKSPQQVMGTLVKEWLGTKWNKTPDQIYHITVMPCYDKKLEASRQDFYNEAYATRDVDCVITTGELQLLMQDKGWDLSIPVADENVPCLPPSLGLAQTPTTVAADPQAFPELLMHPGTSSGSYLQSLISTIISSAPDPGALELTTQNVRSADYEEYTLTHRETGQVVFRGAKCYGFRNLQNVVRKVGRDAGVQVGRGAAGRLAGVRGRAVRKGAAAVQEDRGYDYVEVMACPSGCVNGGGQLRPVQQAQTDAEGLSRDWQESGVSLGAEESLPAAPISAKWGDKEWTKKVEAAYWRTLPTPPPTPPAEGKPSNLGSPFELADEFAGRVLREITKAAPLEGKIEWTTKLDDKAESRRQRLFRTQYRAVESEVVGLAVKW
ncbi:iron hydrogenase [Lentinus tigrinus ALCF2SS1-7]|uniref:iron hydrogenase n=1 Tax=Lentinus tigrinus ALCF2SS1-7 TaxID=1328758 RepID=UPI001165D9C6|nr:iron hydrogenase [Lentinus tigrinus ALCF2SS1-7]